MSESKIRPDYSVQISEAIADQNSFGFESSVYSRLKTLQPFDIVHSEPYFDPDSGKLREFDIRMEHRSRDGRYRALWALECKNVSELYCILGSSYAETEKVPTLPVYHIDTTLLNRQVSIGASTCLLAERGRVRSISRVKIESDRKTNRLEASLGDDVEMFERYTQCVSSLRSWLPTAITEAFRNARCDVKIVGIPAVIVPNGTLYDSCYSSFGTPGVVRVRSMWFKLFRKDPMGHELWSEDSYIPYVLILELNELVRLADLFSSEKFLDEFFDTGYESLDPSKYRQRSDL